MRQNITLQTLLFRDDSECKMNYRRWSAPCTRTPSQWVSFARTSPLYTKNSLLSLSGHAVASCEYFSKSFFIQFSCVYPPKTWEGEGIAMLKSVSILKLFLFVFRREKWRNNLNFKKEIISLHHFVSLYNNKIISLFMKRRRKISKLKLNHAGILK